MKNLPQLKYVREGRTLSQRDLAAMSGVAHDTIGQLERGERQARPSTIRKLAEALGVEPSVLIAESQIGAWEQMNIARSGQGLYETFEEVQARRGRALEGDKTLAKSYTQDVPTKRMRRRTDDRMHRWEERKKLEADWEAEGKWAEYYVAGRAAHIDKVTGDAAIDAAVRDRSEKEYLRYTLLLPKGANREERAIAWAKLDSGDLKEIEEVAVKTPLAIYAVLDQLSNRQTSFETIPRRHYEDQTSRRRVEELRVALQEYQHEAADAVEDLLEIHTEALRQLEAVMEIMRKEGEELARIVHRAASELLKS